MPSETSSHQTALVHEFNCKGNRVVCQAYCVWVTRTPSQSICNVFYPSGAFTVGFLAASLADRWGVRRGRCGSASASALSCCKTHTIVTPTPKKPKRFFLFILVVKHNEFAAFSGQDALVAPWPPQLPESSPESSQRASESFPDASQMPPSRCLLQDASFQRAKKALFGFSR